MRLVYRLTWPDGGREEVRDLGLCRDDALLDEAPWEAGGRVTIGEGDFEGVVVEAFADGGRIEDAQEEEA